MEQVTEIEKKTVTQKLLEFQKKGLVSYGKYLAEQLEFASQSESRKAYYQYVKKQLANNQKKISRINKKLE